jgi:hypothetical protein
VFEEIYEWRRKFILGAKFHKFFNMGAKTFPDLTYFLLDTFNTCAVFLSSFLNFFSKLPNFYIYKLQNLGYSITFILVGGCSPLSPPLLFRHHCLFRLFPQCHYFAKRKYLEYTRGRSVLLLPLEALTSVALIFLAKIIVSTCRLLTER